jgi:hypothetical protein
MAMAAALQAQCYISYGASEDAKPNKLYLFFPTADDATFPDILDEFGISHGTSPAKPFDVAGLDSTIGTTAQLRDAIHQVVRDDYCEFDVQVLQTTTPPDSLASPPARRVTVAVSSDNNPTLYGIANGTDIGVGDNTVIDYARVWGGSYADEAGGPGGELNGANSTLTRWATAIGGTAAHEAGHTYSLAHSDDVTPRPGEDVYSRHVMPAGGTLSLAQRVGFRRHFSDVTFGLLAANAGLSVQTVHNWDYTNPNSVDARQLRMEILSTQAALTLGWFYNGLRSPWINPTVTPLAGTVTFKGTTYNRFNITWSTGQAWSNNEVAPFEPSGVVGPGKNFHIGAEFVGVDFNTPDPIIVRDVTLLDGSGTALTLHPRMVGYDAGNLDARDGVFRLRLFNADGGAPLQVKNIVVQELPRVLAIESMLTGKPMRTWEGLPVNPWRRRTFSDATVADEHVLDLARLEDKRNIFINYDQQRPRPGTTVSHAAGADSRVAPEVNDVAHGIAVGLFPATTVYVTLTVVDPDAEHWDVAQGRIVRGPVESKLFYQLRGVRPDLNHNGKDDAIDIATGTSEDGNQNGVVDEVEGSGSKRWTLYPFAGPFRFAHALPVNDGTVIGLRAGRRSGATAIEGEIGVTSTDDALGQSGNVVQASVNARRFFGSSSSIRPFAILGLGGLFFNGFTSNDNSVALNGGLGVEVPVGPSFLLRFDGRDFVTFDAYGTGSKHNWQLTAGFGFPLP